MAQEIELKLAFPPGAHRQILAHPLVLSAPRAARTATLENTYFDTPGMLLGEARIALRTRRIGRRMLQTVKCANVAAGGLSARPEWEYPFQEQFDFSGVSDDATRALLEAHRDEIGSLFSTTFRRETRSYTPREGVRILLMIDTGTVRAAGREASIAELELELADGTPQDLVELALQLAADLPLMPENTSKAERGYQLFLGESPKALRAQRCRLSPGTSVVDAFRTLANEALGGWQANALGALQHDDPEFIHQLRVALRRLRTLLRVFEAHLPLGFAGNWQIQLAALADSVGQARDYDVLHDSLLLEPTGSTQAPDFAPLLIQIEDDAAASRIAARRALEAPAMRLLQLQFFKALHFGLHDSETNEELSPFAAASLQRLRKRVASRLRQAADSQQAEDLHRLRIACKRLRYACEFFSSLFGDKAMRRYLAPLAEALERLGELNDVAVGSALLRSRYAQHAEAVQWIAGWHAAHAERRTARALRRVASFLDLDPPWLSRRAARVET